MSEQSEFTSRGHSSHVLLESTLLPDTADKCCFITPISVAFSEIQCSWPRRHGTGCWSINRMCSALSGGGFPCLPLVICHIFAHPDYGHANALVFGFSTTSCRHSCLLDSGGILDTCYRLRITFILSISNLLWRESDFAGRMIVLCFFFMTALALLFSLNKR